MSNILLNYFKYAIVGCLVWVSFHLSHVQFLFGSCIILSQLAGFLEWSFKIWMVRQLENLGKWNVEQTHKIVNKAMDRR